MEPPYILHTWTDQGHAELTVDRSKNWQRRLRTPNLIETVLAIDDV